MNPSRLFIERPVATALFMLAILLAGILGYRQLALSALPEVDYPTIQVTTLYPGASPDVMTSLVTAPLERQFGQMPGLNQMTSSSSGGASVITLQFSLALGLDAAEQQVQAAINAASNLLPADLLTPPLYSKVNPADAPVLSLAVTSASIPMTRVQDMVDTRIAPKISQLPGVGLVTLAGGQRPAVRIQANPPALAAYGLNMDDVRSIIAAANVKQAKGSFDGPERASTIDANDQLRSAAEYANLVLAFKNGAPVRLRDVASVVDDAENNKLAAWADRTPAIIVNVQRQPGANVIEVVDRIKAIMPALQASLPAAVEVRLLTDRTITIRASVRDVQFELMLAIALVVMVIFLFLRNVRATLIPSVAVPLSLVGTFGVMYLAGFSINNLTLMALTIATGFVVDDAIVMIENISRYIEEGETPLTAALKGSRQIAFTIISLTVSLIAVLIPLLFMGDVVGRLFREFSITLAVAILISALVSLTLTPMMCARLLRHEPQAGPDAAGTAQRGALSRIMHAAGRWFDHVVALYARALDWVLDRQAATLLVAFATLVLTGVLYWFIPKGFFPIQDTGVIQAITEAPQSVSFASMAERQQRLADAILQDPAVASLSSFIGVDGANATLNTGRMLINLKPRGERGAAALDAADVRAVMRHLQERVAGVPGVTLYMQPVQDLTIEDQVSRSQYQLTLDTPDYDELARWVPRLVERMRALPQLADVGSNLQSGGGQAFVDIDRDTAGRLGITPAAISNALYNAFGQRMISTIFTQASQYRVILESTPTLQNEGLRALEQVYVTATRAANGVAVNAQVPLSTVARVREGTAPLVIGHLAQFPAATISFNLAHGAALGDAVKAIDAARAELAIPLSVGVRYQGAAEAFEGSLENTLWLILAAVVTMYIVLGVLYESYIHPVTILSTLPSAAVGALLALQLTGNDLGIIAVIGIILLIGIVKKNAIMMIDFALDAERTQGLAPRAAIRQACLLRLRPILMTTMAALLGALPLVIGGGVGTELRQPLGITMVGGLIASQVLTLFTTPVIYLGFEWLSRRTRKALGKPEAAPHAVVHEGEGA